MRYFYLSVYFIKEKLCIISLQNKPKVRSLTFNKKSKVIRFYRSLCLDESVKFLYKLVYTCDIICFDAKPAHILSSKL